MTIRAAFLGTPAAAIPALQALHAIADVEVVFTRPDRPRGRSKAPVPSPVKLAAGDLGLSVAQPTSKEELGEVLAGIPSLDVAVLVAYGMIIPEEVLEVPAKGFVNIHFSLLPRWRGAAPVQRAIAEGDPATGVTLMRMDAGLDTGGIISEEEVAISQEDNTDTLTDRLAALGAEVLTRDLQKYLDGELRVRQQSSTGVTYAAKVLPEEARLDLTEDQESLHGAIRAFNPQPGAFAKYEDDRLKIWIAEPRSLGKLSPGELEVVTDELLLGTGTTALALVEVQPAGKRRMSGVDWARGRRGELGRLR